jgi:hypothetical protein
MIDNSTQHDDRSTENHHKPIPSKRFVVPCLAAASLALVGCQIAMKAQQPAQPAPGSRASASTLPATNTNAVVDAANTFLATLSQQQQAVVQIELTPQNAARWSNFPSGWSHATASFSGT